MLDKPDAPAPLFADHDGRLILHRKAAAAGRQTFTATQAITLKGPSENEATILVEVEFYLSARGSAPSSDDPGWPDEYDVSAVTPFEYRKLPTGFLDTTPHYLPAPNWLIDMLARLVDVDQLDGDRW